MIEAIPTEYNGCSFRSRTEARWAAFFDLIGLRWEYEPEGYVLADGTWYLPDFWLPQMGAFAEVKSDAGPTDGGWFKASRLCDVTATNVLILDGAPWPRVYEMLVANRWCVSRETFCWHDKYVGPEAHDGEPRVYFQPAEYEPGNQPVVVAMMDRARKVRLDEPSPGLPLGWEGVEPVT